MIKKILFWTIFAAIIGLTIYGAIIRTNSKLADSSPERNAGQVQESVAEQSRGGGNQGTGQGNRQENLNAITTPSITTPESQVVALSAESEHEWLTLEGVVASIDSRTLTVTLDDGQTLLVERRPWRFAQESGFTTSLGNQLVLTGFYEADAFQVAQIDDLTSGLSVQLRDETGHPLWASE